MLPYLVVANARAWAQWLIAHAATSPGVWLHLARKGHAIPTTLTWEEAVDEALCHGWIDGQAGRVPTSGSAEDIINNNNNETHGQAPIPPPGSTRVVRFTPRRKGKSIWSQKNVGNIARLQAEGRMYPMGEAAVQLAKTNGTWDAAYAGSSNATPPQEFLDALEKAKPRARAMYDILTSQNRYAIYFRLQSLKTQDAKERNIKKYVEMLEKGETIHPQKRKLEASQPEEEEEVDDAGNSAEVVVDRPRKRSTSEKKVSGTRHHISTTSSSPMEELKAANPASTRTRTELVTGKGEESAASSDRRRSKRIRGASTA